MNEAFLLKPDWNKIETALIDMDGTLLDLHFDTYFWLEYVPIHYSQNNNISIDEAKQKLLPMMRSHEGTMKWYCLDFWSQELGLDISGLKYDLQHKIAIHDGTIDFLEELRNHVDKIMLVTNAHFDSLNLKLEVTEIDKFFDDVVSSHKYGMPKEEQGFWKKLQQEYPFENESTVMIDDSVRVLESARLYGIGYQIAIKRPDTQMPEMKKPGFYGVASLGDVAF
mgnify:CR=1 FL=1